MKHRRSRSVLARLRQDSRTTLASMARAEGVAVSTIFDHVRNLERDVIERHVTLLDFPAAGFPFRTYFSALPRDQEATLTYLCGHASTNNVHLMSNGRVGAEMIFSTLQAEEEALEQLRERCSDVRQHRVLSTLLQEGWTPERKASVPLPALPESARKDNLRKAAARPGR